MPLVSVTRLRVRAWRFLPGFFLRTFQASRQAKAADGFLSLALLNDANLTFWTRTIWRDEAAMRAFMFSGAHRHAMPRLQDWCDEASLVHWTQETGEAPSWPEAHRRMQQEGRPSKLKHPSAAQLRFEIPAPRTP
jgi:hypothetical protein